MMTPGFLLAAMLRAAIWVPKKAAFQSVRVMRSHWASVTSSRG